MRGERAVVPVVKASWGSAVRRFVWVGARMGPLVGSFLLAGLLSLGLAPSARAACRVGLIDTDTVWSVADSPCIVNQSVWVLEGVTLTIEPGVVVKVNPGLGIQIDGTLIARGTATDPITFTSNVSLPARGDWGYLLFTNTSTDATFDNDGNYLGGSLLEYCIVEYAGRGDYPAMRLQSSSPLIHHCIVRNNLKDGINATGIDRELRIESNEVTGNGGYGIYANNTSVTTVTVSDNTVTNNGGAGIAISSTSTTIITVHSNTVTHNGGTGIYAFPGTSTISSNVVTDNGDTGIDMSGMASDPSMTSIISSNTVTGNGGSGFSSIGTYGATKTLTISSNTITDNKNKGIDIWWSTSTISYNIITRNSKHGIYFYGGIQTISYNTITSNGDKGIYLFGTYWETSSISYNWTVESSPSNPPLIQPR